MVVVRHIEVPRPHNPAVFTPDLRALTLIVACSTFLLVIGLRLLERVSDDVPVIRTWTAGAVQWIGGFVLLALRDLIPAAASVVIGNVLIVTGATWMYFGLRLSLQLPRGPRWDLLLGGAATLGLVLVTYPTVIPWGRVAVVGAISAIPSLISVIVIVRTRKVWRSELRRMPWLLGVVMAANSAVQWSRAARAVLDPASVTPESQQGALTLTMIAIIALNAVMTLALMALMASRVQDRLSRHRDELERQVAERTDQLRSALAASEAANAAKASFLANMSHEIRTPLNAILGNAYLIKRELTAPKQLERLKRIAEAGQVLHDTLGAVIDLARLQSRETAPKAEPVGLQAVADRAMAQCSNAMRSKGLSMTTQVAPGAGPLRGDPDRLHQALGHLLNNAAKFTDSGGVTLEVSWAERGDAGVEARFDVIDTGIGIPSEVLPRLFAPFTQRDGSSTRDFDGSGLGLAIVRELAASMGGQVGVDSTPGQGSRFWFTARLAREAVAAPAPTPAEVA